jgi:hypothetical protein
MIFKQIYVISLILLSLDILVRRLVMNEIPTQLNPILVYGLLLLNGYAVYRVRASTKKGKS